MATKKKLATVTETAAPKAATKAAAPKRHSKAIPATETSAAPAPAGDGPLDSHEVSQLAYSYFAARGYRHGSQVEDWFRAERELRQRRLR